MLYSVKSKFKFGLSDGEISSVILDLYFKSVFPSLEMWQVRNEVSSMHNQGYLRTARDCSVTSSLINSQMVQELLTDPLHALKTMDSIKGL